LLGAVDHMLVLNEGRMQAFGPTESVLPLLSPKPAHAIEPKPERRARRKVEEPADEG
jgi:ATP-binding cassette, subfamily C, bacterial PrsD